MHGQCNCGTFQRYRTIPQSCGFFLAVMLNGFAKWFRKLVSTSYHAIGLHNSTIDLDVARLLD